MKQVVIYGIVAVVVVLVISYLYATRTSEAYIDTPFNLVIVDGNGNMSSVSVRPPSLAGVPPTSNVVYVDTSGNIGIISIGDIYTSYQGNSSSRVRNLLTIDANNNLSTLPSHNFSPCHINGDPNTNPNATMNGTPQRDGTCVCRNNWTGTTKGDGCAVCDGYGITHVDGSFGPLAGADCQFSRVSNCSSNGNVNGSGVCKCDPTYIGSDCKKKDIGPPSQVTNIHYNSDGSISWNPPAFDGNSPIVGYSVQGESFNEYSGYGNWGGSTTTTSIFLESGVYYVNVYATNAAGYTSTTYQYFGS